MTLALLAALALAQAVPAPAREPPPSDRASPVAGEPRSGDEAVVEHLELLEELELLESLELFAPAAGEPARPDAPRGDDGR